MPGSVEQASYDVAVVGAGIVGLAHALAAARRGMRVLVLDRDERASGASVRNFGFITISGQAAGSTWQRARRSRDVWMELIVAAGIPLLQQMSTIVARTSEGMAVLEEFAAGPMGEGCTLLTPDRLRLQVPMIRDGAHGALRSALELRVDPRTAIPRLATYLTTRFGVTIVRNALVRSVEPPNLDTTAGEFRAQRIVVCPGADLQTLFAESLSGWSLRQCKLQMLRLAPQPSGWRLPTPVMGDLTLARYAGFADCPSVTPLRLRLEQDKAAAVSSGVHLIVVQDADGSLVIGDSHEYAQTASAFGSSTIEQIILSEATEMLEIANTSVVERWIGIYPWHAELACIIEAPASAVRIAMLTSGTGMSTAFAIGEEVIADLTGEI